MMEYILMIVWVILIGLETTLHWNRIENIKKPPKHWLWSVPRFIAGGVFLYLFSGYGYLWYWSTLYLVVTHMLIFPEALNLARGKGLGYLGDPDLGSPNKSIYDKILLTVSKSDAFKESWFWFRAILFLFAVLNLVVQGKEAF